MIRILYFILLCISIFFVYPFSSLGQSGSTLQVGQMIKQTMKESWADVEPIGQDDQGVYYLMLPYTEVMSGIVIGDTDFYISLINEKAELVKKTPTKFLVDGKPSRYEFTQEIGGKILFFTTMEDKKAKTVTFFSHELDKKALQLINTKKVVQLSFAQIKREYERSSFKVELSRDKSKMLISYSLIDDENSILTFGYVVLDGTMKEIYKWAGNLDMSDGVYLFDQFRINNKGEVYLLTRYFQNSKALNKNTAMKKANILSSTRSMEIEDNYEHRVVRFESNGATKIIPVTNSNKFYTTLDIEIAGDGSPILIGFYAPEGTLPSGAVCLKVNSKTNSISEISTKEFGNQFQLPSDMSIKNNGLTAGEDQYRNYRFILSDIQFNKNGGYTLIGERTVTQTKRNGNVFYTVNHQDDLAVVDVTSTGTIQAVLKVNKSQQAVDFEIFNSSYFYAEHNNNKLIAFSNLGKGGTNESVLIRISPDGKQTREVMFSTKDAEITIRPKDCQLYKSNKLILYGQKNNRYVRWIGKQL